MAKFWHTRFWFLYILFPFYVLSSIVLFTICMAFVPVFFVGRHLLNLLDLTTDRASDIWTVRYNIKDILAKCAAARKRKM